ncbi:MAG: MaoC/PaaZ C-terminal domain-containing protein [Chloroflexota bacterium]|nr:MaoC/PaaZ C-terminal domain-containing protein [Chloroflexota bacterium]
MSEQLYFEDVEIGAELLPLLKYPEPRQLVKFAGASEDFNEIHYNKDKALADGLPGIIVHGRLKNAFLVQLLTDWAGDEGALKKIAIQHRAMDFPEHPLVCRGKVTNKYTKNGQHLVECEVWTENEKGEKTAPGTATVVLPSRS